jgi:hypothetical protein
VIQPSPPTRSLPRIDRRPYLPLCGLAVFAAAALAALASRVHDWVVMTDELQYTKLATHIGETLSPLPTLRGVHVSAYAQLYPLLLAPLFGTLSAPSAFHAAHWLDGVLFASATVPAYLLARELALTRRWSLVCSVLCLAIPWNVLSAFVMTESSAYPVFLWTLLAFTRALVKPSPQHDLVAVAAAAVAVLARTQFLVLAVVLPLASLLVDGPRAFARRRVLVGASVVGLFVAGVFRSRVFGSYSATATGGSVLRWRTFEQAGAHLDVVGVGIGLLPLLVGGAWLVVSALRRSAVATPFLLTIVVITIEASAYDVRVGGGLAGIRSRYVFYIAPLLLLAMVRALVDANVPRLALAGMTAFVAVTVFAHDFLRVPGLYVDAPEAALNGAIHDSGGATFVALVAVVLTLVLTVVRIPIRLLTMGACVFTFLASIGTAGVAWHRLLDSHSASGRPVTDLHGLVLDWIDRSLPSGAHAAILPYPTSTVWNYSALRWWDVELWNKSVDDAYRVHATWDYAPFPAHEMDAVPATGVVRGSRKAPAYVIVSEYESRLGLAGSIVARSSSLDVLHVPRPYRLRWQSHGLDPDGWTRPGRRAWIHIFPRSSSRAWTAVAVSLARANQITAQVCGAGDVPLPNKPTGKAPPVPLAPGEEGEPRTVGVQVFRVELSAGPSC